MTRRELLTSLSLLAGSRSARAGPQLEISGARLREQIESLSVYGRPFGGPSRTALAASVTLTLTSPGANMCWA